MINYNYVYLIPLLLSIAGLVFYGVRSGRDYQTGAISFIKKGNFLAHGCITRILGRLIDRRGGLYKFYAKRLLRYSNISIEALFEIKLFLFAGVLILALLVKYTNISLMTKDIYTRFDYEVDLLYEHKDVKDKMQAMEQEIGYFQEALKNIKKNELDQSAEDVQVKIKSLIQKKDSELLLPKDTLANKIYHRLKDYYAIRRLNLPWYMLVAFLVSFGPEVFLAVGNVFTKADAKNELRFLKKLIIMNGSIPPVDFLNVLDSLVDKSKYYRKVLEEIREGNRKNSVDTRALYTSYIKESKDITEKLFFEKLDEANNYDFKQAVTNIENEFRLEKREAVRNVRKRIELIHVIGVIGFMLLVALMTLYLIIPWMNMYNISQIGF